jgi:hypothetical protein
VDAINAALCVYDVGAPDPTTTGGSEDVRAIKHCESSDPFREGSSSSSGEGCMLHATGFESSVCNINLVFLPTCQLGSDGLKVGTE